MYERLQDAAMYQRLQKAGQAASSAAKEAANQVKAGVMGKDVNEVRGYEMVDKTAHGTGFLAEDASTGSESDTTEDEADLDADDDDEEEGGYGGGGIDREDVKYWSPEEVAGFLRRQLLEFEGADEDATEAVMETFRDQDVDGNVSSPSACSCSSSSSPSSPESSSLPFCARVSHTNNHNNNNVYSIIYRRS